MKAEDIKTPEQAQELIKLARERSKELKELGSFKWGYYKVRKASREIMINESLDEMAKRKALKDVFTGISDTWSKPVENKPAEKQDK